MEYKGNRPIVVGVLGMVHKDLEKKLKELKIRDRIKTIQTSEFLKLALNTQKNLGDLGRLTITQTLVRNHLLKLVGETHKEFE